MDSLTYIRRRIARAERSLCQVKTVLRRLEKRLEMESASIPAEISIIQGVVIEHFMLDQDAMTTHRRTQHIAEPRQIAMALCAKLTKFSLSAIGQAFGGRDHGTIIYGVQRIHERILLEPELNERYYVVKAEAEQELADYRQSMVLQPEEVPA